MLRKIIEIDEAKCNGCGICVQACHEGAIGLVDGKARLLRDDYCDGLGDCLPTCPTGAIMFIEREAAAYDETAILSAKETTSQNAQPRAGAPSVSAAPSTPAAPCTAAVSAVPAAACAAAKPPTPASPCAAAPCTSGASSVAETPSVAEAPSALAQWPCEIRLVPVQAPYFEGAHLLIAADCTAFAYARFHERFMQGRTTIIGCPKLDAFDYADKLEQIFSANTIASITVARMEVPCCGGLEQAARIALDRSGKQIPLRVATFSVRGELLSER